MFDSGMKDNATYYNKHHVEKMRKKIKDYDEDPNKMTRQGEMICKHCYYIMNDGIAGQAFWTKNCANCGKEMDFPTTDTDELCLKCAKELDCCKHCGAKLD